MSDRLEIERTAFEDFFLRNGWSAGEFERGNGGRGDYLNRQLASLWCGWIARARTTIPGALASDEGQR